MSSDGRLLKIGLRHEARFHDGTPVNAATVAAVLKATLPQWVGASAGDVEEITAPNDWEVDIRLTRRSNLVLESLEVPIRKAGNIGTGPYIVDSADQTQLKANEGYFLGRPMLDRLVLSRYPSIRSAWADMLRGQIDMLFDVSLDAVDSLTSATNVRMVTFTKAYQYIVVFNRQSPYFHDQNVRRALSLALDRTALVRNALRGYGVPSSDPTWPRYWAIPKDQTVAKFDPVTAAQIMKAQRKPLRFECLVSPEYDAIGLEVKRQLAAIGVDMVLREVSSDRVVEALSRHDFDAVLAEFLSGPSFARIYWVWHLKGGFDFGIGNANFDAALDRARYAATDDEFRDAIATIEKLAVEDPPGLFLAWSQGIRAISTKFPVPIERDRDPLGALKSWRRPNGTEYVNRN